MKIISSRAFVEHNEDDHSTNRHWPGRMLSRSRGSFLSLFRFSTTSTGHWNGVAPFWQGISFLTLPASNPGCSGEYFYGAEFFLKL